MPRTNIVLVGFMGSGKSSIGRIVAGRMGFLFVDTDLVISQRAGMEISQIFAREGEDGFRDRETEAIESLGDLDRCVIATGGVCAFGRWRGVVRVEGRELAVDGLLGWAEEFAHRW